MGWGAGGRRLEPAPLLKVKKLNKAKIWVQLAGMEVGQNGEEMGGGGGKGRKVRRGDRPFGCAGCSADVHLAPIA